MSNTVFILGAGASAEAGGPVMTTFLDEAEAILRSGPPGSTRPDFERVFRAINGLRSIYSKAWLDPDNVESVFGAFEMGGILGKLGDFPTDEISDLRRSIRRVIATTLGRRIRFPVASDGKIGPAAAYGGFVDLIRDMRRKKEGVSVLTFNYDVALDFSAGGKVEFDYCLENDPAEGSVPLLKLHGSTNWVVCPACKEISAWRYNDYRVSHSYATPGQYFFSDVASDRSGWMHCGQTIEGECVLIPPTWNKAQFQNQIDQVWKASARELESAENIYVIGYSLPETDQFFRYLFALGSVGEARLKKFVLVDPNASAIEDRYKEMLGPLARNRFRAESARFGSTLSQIRGEFGLP